MVRGMGGVMAEHALAFVRHKRILPPTHMIVERLCREGLVSIFAIARAGAHCISWRGLLSQLAILADRAQEWILVVVNTLVDHCLEGGCGERMAAEVKFLNHGEVAG